VRLILLEGRVKMQRASDRLRKWRKKERYKLPWYFNSLRNTLYPRTRQLRQLTTELMTPTHLAPSSAYHATKPPHLCRAKHFHQAKPRSCHSSRVSRDSCHANTILDPPRESFQLSGRSPIRCMKHKRVHASLVLVRSST